MRKSTFSENQIVGILKEVEAGQQVKEVCREHGISMPPTASGNRSMAAWGYRTSNACESWMRTASSSYGGGPEPGEPGDQGSIRFKVLAPDEKRLAVTRIKQHGMSARQACWAIGLSRSVLAYENRATESDEAISLCCRNWQSASLKGGLAWQYFYFKLIRRRGYG